MAQNKDNNLPKSLHAEREEKALEFWQKNKIFEKSVEKEAPNGEFTFYDGPPFATGLPHYGHILAGTMKDVIPRWKTMQGYKVRRRWGWDCHGLPVENLIEKELGLKTKKEILEYGIGKFNEAARSSVMRYADEWRMLIPRMGRFVDMDNDYRTMDASYTESVWWIFQKLANKGLIYEGFKSMNLCPRCETTLSNFEVAQGYKDITDISVYVKFKIKEQSVKSKDGDEKFFNISGNTYLIAWTTTPWTLPGNVALAVNPEIDYVQVSSGGQTFIIAESRLSSVFKDKQHEIIGKVKGSDLVGLTYEPLFNFYANDISLKNKENGWQVYPADFVTTEDGTGIVHIAPAFGADDYKLLEQFKLPFVQHVNVDGSFNGEWVNTKDLQDLGFAGVQVKPKSTDENKNAHQDTDVKIIKYLAKTGLLFEKEKLTHSYPHCWRCDTPLLNYAASSWFVKVTDLKDKLIAENNKIKWVPPEVGDGRFGNWLENVRDWAISRSRFWGAPIPVWRKIKDDKLKSKNGDKRGIDAQSDYVVIGSLEELKRYSKSKNTYYVIRHGEADNNVLGVLSGKAEFPHHLTEKGRAQVSGAADSLQKIKFDKVIVSPFVRTKETAQILADKLGITKDKITYEPRIGEYQSGAWHGKSIEEYVKQFPDGERYERCPEKGETYSDIKKRMGQVLYELEEKNEDKNILIVTHELPAFFIMAAGRGLTREQAMKMRKAGYFVDNAAPFKLDFSPLPHNSDYELDLHRPYIDEVRLELPDGTKLERVPDVFDCWFESGAMPYGSNHYPFENLKRFDPVGKWGRFVPEPLRGACDYFGCSRNAGYPADFIAEGLDQTRGWFYSMLVLGVALFGKTPYKKVLVNGLVLAEDGQKMSKSKKNYPDPMLIVDKYGADSLRYYLLASPVVRSQDLCFSEKGVDEITKKLVNRLLNVLTFYEMYAGLKSDGEVASPGTESSLPCLPAGRLARSSFSAAFAASERPGSTTSPSDFSRNVLDKWIISRLNEIISQVTSNLEAGELDRAARPFMDLIDDLSTWYLRRSRDRFKGDDEADKKAALETTAYVLEETAKLLAPFMPFLAEDVYQRVARSNYNEDKSVHLEEWPKIGKVDADIIANMKIVRDVASLGLEARTVAKINVRQPLAKLAVNAKPITEDGLVALIRDEVNVKEVVFNDSAASDSKLNVVLDTEITSELKEEGNVRELLRIIQDLRKEAGLTVNDKAVLVVDANDDGRKLIEMNREEIMKTTSLGEIKWGSVEGEITKIGDASFKISIEK